MPGRNRARRRHSSTPTPCFVIPLFFLMPTAIEPFLSKKEALDALLERLVLAGMPDYSEEAKGIENKMAVLGYHASDSQEKRATALAYVIILNTLKPSLRLTRQEALLLAAVPDLSPTLRQFATITAATMDGKTFESIEVLVKNPDKLSFDIFPISYPPKEKEKEHNPEGQAAREAKAFLEHMHEDDIMQVATSTSDETKKRETTSNPGNALMKKFLRELRLEHLYEHLTKAGFDDPLKSLRKNIEAKDLMGFLPKDSILPGEAIALISAAQDMEEGDANATTPPSFSEWHAATFLQELANTSRITLETTLHHRLRMDRADEEKKRHWRSLMAWLTLVEQIMQTRDPDNESEVMEVGQTILNLIREHDANARYGGEVGTRIGKQIEAKDRGDDFEISLAKAVGRKRVDNRSKEGFEGTCFNCGRKGHRAAQCRQPKAMNPRGAQFKGGNSQGGPGKGRF